MRKSFTDEQFETALWGKIDKTRTCWIFIGAVDNHGYGKIRYGGRTLGAHRVVYILLKGEIPKGLDLDHLCRVRCCVNPAHLQPVDRQTNVMRGVVARRRNMCVAGLHKMTAHNTYMNPTTGKTRCIACRNAYRRKYWLEKHDNRGYNKH